MEKQPTIKILVGYHKPATLFKSDILVPIHLGRAVAKDASKDGVLSECDYQWMVDNMIGDDTGENISHLNREYCEFTGIYWTWKNYEKLGNPDYIGFMHYRRLFAFETTKDEKISYLIHPENYPEKLKKLLKDNLKKYDLTTMIFFIIIAYIQFITRMDWIS